MATDALIALYLKGEKTAGSSLVRDFISAGGPLPAPGNYWIVLDRLDRPRLIAKTLRVERHRFEDIPASVARAEGEGDRSVGHWKKVHRKAYLPYLEKWGIARIEEAEVVTEHFSVVHRRSTAPTYDGTALGVLAYEFPTDDREAVDGKVAARLKTEGLGAFDPLRVGRLRRLKDALQAEIGKGSRFFRGTKARFVELDDFDIPALTDAMLLRFPAIPWSEVDSFVPFCVFVYHML